MDKAGYLHKLRLFLADPDGKIWDDIELYTLLDESLEKYCIDSGAVIGKFDFFPDRDGIYHYPDDCGKYLIGWNEVGEEIKPATARDLFMRSAYYSVRDGSPGYIYDELGSYGEFSLYPNPALSQDAVSIRLTPFYGEVTDDNYGVYIIDDYGTTLSVDRFEYAGTFYYSKVGDYEDVKDYMAVICYALYLAYNSDSDFANGEMASYWERLYKERLGVFGRVLHNNSGNSTTVNFY